MNTPLENFRVRNKKRQERRFFKTVKNNALYTDHNLSTGCGKDRRYLSLGVSDYIGKDNLFLTD